MASRRFWVNPFRTAVPFWWQSTRNLSGSSPKRGCGSKRVKKPRHSEKKAEMCYLYGSTGLVWTFTLCLTLRPLRLPEGSGMYIWQHNLERGAKHTIIRVYNGKMHRKETDFSLVFSSFFFIQFRFPLCGPLLIASTSGNIHDEWNPSPVLGTNCLWLECFVPTYLWDCGAKRVKATLLKQSNTLLLYYGGGIVNRTYGIYTWKPIYLTTFTNNIWSY